MHFQINKGCFRNASRRKIVPSGGKPHMEKENISAHMWRKMIMHSQIYKGCFRNALRRRIVPSGGKPHREKENISAHTWRKMIRHSQKNKVPCVPYHTLFLGRVLHGRHIQLLIADASASCLALSYVEVLARFGIHRWPGGLVQTWGVSF